MKIERIIHPPLSAQASLDKSTLPTNNTHGVFLLHRIFGIISRPGPCPFSDLALQLDTSRAMIFDPSRRSIAHLWGALT